MAAESPDVDPFGSCYFAKYRYATATVVKLMIRARAKIEPNFLSTEGYRRWGLENIAEDNYTVESLLAMAAAAFDVLGRSYVFNHGSGGVAEDDPMADIRLQVIEFASDLNPSQTLAQHRAGQKIDWERVARWDLLSELRDSLDRLPTLNGESEKPPPVEILDRKKRDVVVCGKTKHPTTGRIDIIELLLKSYPETLSKDQLAEQSGHGDAVNMLKKMAKDDPDWSAVIHLAGSTGGGYGLKHPDNPEPTII